MTTPAMALAVVAVVAQETRTHVGQVGREQLAENCLRIDAAGAAEIHPESIERVGRQEKGIRRAPGSIARQDGDCRGRVGAAGGRFARRTPAASVAHYDHAFKEPEGTGLGEQNALLRAARERLTSRLAPGEPMTRAELAEAVNAWLWEATDTRYDLDDHLIGKWERGIVRWPMSPYRAALRAVLDVERDAELGFISPTRRCAGGSRPASASSVARPWTRRAIVADATTVAEQYLITRRQALTGAAAAGGAGLLVPLAPWLDALAHTALSSRRGAFALDEVESIEAITARFRSWRSPTMGLGRTAVVGQLSDVVDRLRDAPDGPLTDRVFVAAAELAKISASMGFDAGQHASAQDHYILAVRLAKAGRNLSFGAVALAALARQLFDLGRPGDGLEVVALAQRGSDADGSQALRAMLATRQAWGHAQRGETYAFQRAVYAAEELHADVDMATEPWWLQGLDAAEMAGVIGARYRDLARFDDRQAGTAEQYIERALSTRDTARTRNRAFDLVSLARAQLVTGDCDRAASNATAAVGLLDPVRPGRLARKLAEWRQESAPLATDPRIRESRDRIMTALSSCA